MFPILPALILFLMQAHAGGDRAALPLALDAWRTQAVTRGLDGDTVRQVTGVILNHLRKEQASAAPMVEEEETSPEIPPAPTPRISEANAEVQRSRDGPIGF